MALKVELISFIIKVFSNIIFRINSFNVVFTIRDRWFCYMIKFDLLFNKCLVKACICFFSFFFFFSMIALQESIYLFEVLPWKFILLQPYVGWIKIQTCSPKNFPSPWDSVFLTFTGNKFMSRTIVPHAQLPFICSNAAILTVEYSRKYFRS